VALGQYIFSFEGKDLLISYRILFSFKYKILYVILH